MLLHFPVLDRERRVVTTAITNLDLHDIARSAYTYGLSHLYVVHPIGAQRELAKRVQQHWTVGSGARRIPDRAAPLGALAVVVSMEDAIDEFGGGGPVELWTTSAADAEGATLSFREARTRLAGIGPPVLIAFGTGWGLADSVHAGARCRLEAVRSPRVDGYNHLSVRAAAAITFDRLCGVGETR
ncbi:MAG: RNA methyltransferase [Polyangiaceae bacterium]|nr:RNA methyltransferase [Polyangiaceae bacterium]